MRIEQPDLFSRTDFPFYTGDYYDDMFYREVNRILGINLEYRQIQKREANALADRIDQFNVKDFIKRGERALEG